MAIFPIYELCSSKLEIMIFLEKAGEGRSAWYDLLNLYLSLALKNTNSNC